MKFKYLVDAHIHIDDKAFDKDIEQVIERAKTAGVVAIIQMGINFESNRKTLELSKKFDIVKPGLGVFPLDGVGLAEAEGRKEKKFDFDKELEFIEKNKNKLICIGEVGLDKYYTDEKFDLQIKNFEKIISLTEKIKKPIMIHSRKAEQFVIEMLESSSIKNIIMHCFGGKLKLTKRIIDNGWFMTIPTNIVRSEHFQKIAELLPLSRTFCETDAPCLSPYPGKRNEPAFVVESYKKIAEIKKMDVHEVERIIFNNYQRFFL